MLSRRALAAGIVGAIATPRAHARLAQAGAYPPNNAPWLTPDVHISAGQSWRNLAWSGMTDHGINPETANLLTLGYLSGGFPSGVLPISAGEYLPPAVLPKLVGYTKQMTFIPPVGASGSDIGNACTIGRIAVLAQQMLRQAAGVKRLKPIIEFCMAFPGSTWLAGGGGGLGNATCKFQGSQSGNVLTVSSVISGLLVLGQLVIAGPNNLGTIASFGTGSGGVGTYNMVFSNTLGSVGMYSISTAWFCLLTVAPMIVGALPDPYGGLTPARFRSVGWTQGGSFDLSSPAPTISEWGAMTAAYDGMNLPGAGLGGMLFYVGIAAPSSFETVVSNAVIGSWQFVRANANGRTIGTTPWYQWPFNGADTIHTGDYGVLRHGEFEGLAKYVTEDEGVFFTPLWRHLSAPISIVGQTVAIPMASPTGSAFVGKPIAWMSDPNDGVKVWPQYGFHVKRGGTDLTPTQFTLGTDGSNNPLVSITINETLSVGDTLEVSYACYGPGGPTSNGVCSGIGGNLMMAGPPSALFPGETINSWAWPFLETVTK